MKSPFPGMDPYLQEHWGDVHTSLVTYARDQLQENLPAGLIARAQERVYLEREDEPDRSFYPDVLVAEPVIIRLSNDPITERYLEILDARTGKRVITVIEFVSPTNKTPGNGYDLYRQKQAEAEQAGVSLVEIDLVLGGKRVLSVPLSRIKFRYRTRYQAIVRRGWNWREAEVYPLPLHERLSTIPVPLRQRNRDASLNLQALIDKAYQVGCYDDIDYQEESDSPLEGHDAEWADALLRAAGKRQ